MVLEEDTGKKWDSVAVVAAGVCALALIMKKVEEKRFQDYMEEFEEEKPGIIDSITSLIVRH